MAFLIAKYLFDAFNHHFNHEVGESYRIFDFEAFHQQ